MEVNGSIPRAASCAMETSSALIISSVGTEVVVKVNVIWAVVGVGVVLVVIAVIVVVVEAFAVGVVRFIVDI